MLFLNPQRVKKGRQRSLTIPVSAVRCCDWKNTASPSLQLGHGFCILGSYTAHDKTVSLEFGHRSEINNEIHQIIPSPTEKCHDALLLPLPPPVVRSTSMAFLSATQLLSRRTPSSASSCTSTIPQFVLHSGQIISSPQQEQKPGKPTVGSEPTSWVMPAVSPTVLLSSLR